MHHQEADNFLYCENLENIFIHHSVIMVTSQGQDRKAPHNLAVNAFIVEKKCTTLRRSTSNVSCAFTTIQEFASIISTVSSINKQLADDKLHPTLC